METNLIGDRTSVAIECTDVTLVGAASYGRCGLWLGGHQLHDADASVCIDAVLASMQGVASADSSANGPIDVPTSSEEMLSLMQGKSGIQQHFFLAMEAFDDFLKLFSKDDERTYFLWALHPTVASLAIYSQYPKGVQQLVVENQELQRVVGQFATMVAMTKG